LRVTSAARYPRIFLTVSPEAYLSLMEIAKDGPMSVASLATRRKLSSAEVRAACGELVDARLVTSRAADAGQVLFMKPQDNFVASNTLALLGPDSVRVAPPASAHGSGMPIARMSRSLYTYAIDGLGRADE
jgi:hypothetical protein